MGSACGSTLALMDAGVPIKAPVGRRRDGPGDRRRTASYAVLTDIQGIEDALGDMDFKVAGTAEGITALQMDIKVARHHRARSCSEALAQAREGRLFILGKMLAAIAEPAHGAVGVRAAHHQDQRSTRTRSATSSARAAR